MDSWKNAADLDGPAALAQAAPAQAALAQRWHPVQDLVVSIAAFGTVCLLAALLPPVLVAATAAEDPVTLTRPVLASALTLAALAGAGALFFLHLLLSEMARRWHRRAGLPGAGVR